MKTRILAGLALLALAGCSDSTGPSLPNFEGHYVVGGLVNGFPQADITGSISITNQSGDEATVVQTFNFRENGETFVTLFTESPAVAELSPERSISWFFTIEGTTFSASGQLQGNTITGNWNWTGSGESLAGTFSATR